MSESLEQQALFTWAAASENRIPELKLMYHVPNEGKRSPRAGGEQKRQGLKPGVPDICLPVAKSGYHGLYIEMKDGRNKPTAKQKEWLSALAAAGYRSVVCWGCVAAMNEITDYLGLPRVSVLSPEGKREVWE